MTSPKNFTFISNKLCLVCSKLTRETTTSNCMTSLRTIINIVVKLAPPVVEEPIFSWEGERQHVDLWFEVFYLKTSV